MRTLITRLARLAATATTLLAAALLALLAGAVQLLTDGPDTGRPQ